MTSGTANCNFLHTGILFALSPDTNRRGGKDYNRRTVRGRNFAHFKFTVQSA